MQFIAGPYALLHCWHADRARNRASAPVCALPPSYPPPPASPGMPNHEGDDGIGRLSRISLVYRLLRFLDSPETRPSLVKTWLKCLLFERGLRGRSGWNENAFDRGLYKASLFLFLGHSRDSTYTLSFSTSLGESFHLFIGQTHFRWVINGARGLV